MAWPLHERKVAVKVLRPELAAALGAERFLREIKIAARLHHPHILPLYDSGEADGFLYYVMPYVEGESLRDRLNRDRQLPLDATPPWQTSGLHGPSAPPGETSSRQPVWPSVRRRT